MRLAPYARRLARSDADARRVLLVLQGAWHLDMYANIFRALPEIDWTVLIDETTDGVLRLAEKTPRNVQIVGNLPEILLRLDSFALCLTTLATPHRAHVRGLQVYTACARLRIPVLELQHGLFQLGINYVDVSSTPGSGFRNSAMGTAAKNFRDDLITWSGPRGIGLPQFYNLPPAEDHGYVLVLSNLHWSLFTDVERHLFFHGVAKLVRRHPKTRFVWKPHQAEIQPKLEKFHSILLNDEFSNLDVMTKDAMEGRTTTDLIKDCRCAIVSPSSVLLELEMYGKPCVVYNPVSMENLTSMMRRFSSFVDGDELVSKFGKMVKHTDNFGLKTGFLKPFDPARLSTILRQWWSSRVVSKSDLAEAIVPMVQNLEVMAQMSRLRNDTKK